MPRPELAEALKTWDDPVLVGTGSWEEAGDVLADAARMVLEGEPVWWCEVHHQGHRLVGSTATCILNAYREWDDDPCRMVQRTLINQGDE